jgi:hypothetical protein
MTPLDFRDCGGIPPTLNPAAVTFTGIPANRIKDFWLQAEPLLEKAIARGSDETTVSVLIALCQGARQLWAAFTGPDMETMLMAVTTRIVTTGAGRKICEIAHIGGTGIERWLQFLPVIEAWAESQGCGLVRLIGRRGWVRMLAQFDYADCAVVVEKPLAGHKAATDGLPPRIANTRASVTGA